jgi:F-type H+-transporting ATPase subunit gamma
VAGSGLVGIKRRIKSVTNTRKITKAMGLVATAKLRKTKQSLEFNNMYRDSFSKILNEVLDNNEVENIYINGNNINKKLYVVLTSDSGLCGSFNVNVLNKAVEEISKDRKNSLIMVVGEKGVSYFNRLGYDIRAKFVDLPDIPTTKEAKLIGNAAVEMYTKGEIGEINIVYMEFISQSNQEITVEKLLPLKEKSFDFDNVHFGRYMHFEPEIDLLINNLFPMYIREKMLSYLIHSKTSEQSIRMTAMDGATKNANELLDKLKLQYNRMRQGAITQEISEIVGGAEAQK